MRLLGIPVITDRVIEKAVKLVIEPIFSWIGTFCNDLVATVVRK